MNGNMLFPRGAGDVVSDPAAPNPNVIQPNPGVIDNPHGAAPGVNPPVAPPAQAPANPAPVNVANPAPNPAPANPAAVPNPAPPAAPAPVEVAQVTPPAYTNTAAPANVPTSNPYQTTPAAPSTTPATPAAAPANPNQPPAQPQYMSSLHSRANEPVPTVFPRTPEEPTPTPNPNAPAAPTGLTPEQQQALAAEQQRLDGERAQIAQERNQLWQTALSMAGNPATPTEPAPTPAAPTTPVGNPAVPAAVPGTAPTPPSTAPVGFTPLQLDPTQAEPNELQLAQAYNQLGTQYSQDLGQLSQVIEQLNGRLDEQAAQRVNDQMLQAVDQASSQFGVPKEDIYAMYNVYQVPDPFALAELAAGRRLQYDRANQTTTEAVDQRVQESQIVGGGHPTPAPVTTDAPGRGVTNPFDPNEVALKYRAPTPAMYAA